MNQSLTMTKNSRFYLSVQKFILISLLSVWSGFSSAAYTSISVIGDSFSDGGNSETAVVSYYKFYGDPFPKVGNNPKAPYFDYKYSDSYVAVEYLAYFLGMYNKEKFFNYAVGGLMSSSFPEALSYIYTRNNSKLDPTGLYVIELGQVDLMRNMSTPEVASTNVVNGIKDMYNKGARNFLVINSMIMGYTPEYKNATVAQVASAETISRNYNRLLEAKINALTFKDKVTLFDLGNLLRNGQINAASYGFSKPYDACIVNGVACRNPDEYIFWDTVHLASRAHSAIGNSLYQAVKDKAPK